MFLHLDNSGTNEPEWKLTEHPALQPRQRLVVRKGREYLVIKFEDIAYLYLENGVSYLVEKANNLRYITAKPLKNLEQSFQSDSFFRVSKKYLVNINAVVKFRPLKGGKLELVIDPDPKETIIISQLKASLFKQWVNES